MKKLNKTFNPFKISVVAYMSAPCGSCNCGGTYYTAVQSATVAPQ